LGEHARRNIVPAFRTCKEAQLVGVLSRDTELSSQIAQQEGVRSYPNAAAMFGDGAVDAIYLAVSTGLHARLGQTVLEAKRHLWCEKPLAATESERETLLDMGNEFGLAVYEAAMFVHHPQFQRLRQLVHQEEIGRLVSVTARFGFPHLDAGGFRYSKHGGGALLDAGYYPVAAALGLMSGLLEVRGAVLGRESEYDVDTFGAALVSSSEGTSGFLDWGFGREYRNEIELWGTQGTILVERAFSKPADFDTSIRIRIGGDERVEQTGAANQFTSMLDEFAIATAAGNWNELSLSAQAQSAMLGAIQRTGKPGLPS
jgi:NDP-hexose-3-ketoreductase